MRHFTTQSLVATVAMVRVFFPSMFMRLITWKPKKTPPQALLHVPPSMTKHEISEYLTKIYNVDVQKVMTANFLGESWLCMILTTLCNLVSTFSFQANGSVSTVKGKFCRTSDETIRRHLYIMTSPTSLARK